MKNERQESCSKNVDQLRNELYKLISCKKLNSDEVQRLSRELDELILEYYREPKKCQECREP